jgi:DtxR family Mn-dependent transcriptional regulator
MNEILTDSIQDYLKNIYILTGEGEEASTTSLANRLGVAPASVTGMLQKLSALEPPLVIYQKHQGAHLTPEGERAALEVLRHHRLLEAYLVESLGYSWATVHEDACKLEHVISEEFEQRIAESLGHPERDPHGAPIPTIELEMPASSNTRLSSLREGQSAVVQWIRCEDATLLHHLDALGLRPGVLVSATGYSPYDENLTIQVEGHPPSVLGQAVTHQVFVEIIEAE